MPSSSRLKGSTHFESYYNNLCALQDTVPVQSVKAHLAEGALDINADRIRLPDWGPILNSIRINKSLSFIGIRSYFQQIKENDGTLGRQGVRRRPPPVRSKEVVNRLCISLKECLLNSNALQYLELQALPLKEKDITNLAKGLSRASVLEHLSLEGCRLSNKAMSVLCHNLRNSTSLVSLNLSGCGLTCNAAQSIAKVIKHQSTRRHSEAWKESLRYRRPDLDRMAGIRRITLNSNPLLNDEGAAALADAIRDDLWLKALDLQQCGLSNAGAQILLNSLYENSTIVVLDVRKNALVDHEMVKAVIEQVMINGGGHESDYKWLRNSDSTEKSKAAEKPFRKKNRHSTMAVSKKSSKPVASNPASRSRIRSKSADARMDGKNEIPAVRRPGPGFVPWRTAARAVSRGASAERGKNDSDISTPTKDSQSVHFHLTATSTPIGSDSSVKDTSSYVTDRYHGSPSKRMTWTRDEKLKEDKEIRMELEELRRRNAVEMQARKAADIHIVELEVENSRLRHEIQILQARGPSSPFKKQTDQRSDGLGDIDEAVLDSIEESFRKFHAFLDLLRDAGLGQLCSLVGLSPGDIKNPSVASILQGHQPTPSNNTTAIPHEDARQLRRHHPTSSPMPHQYDPARKMQEQLYTSAISTKGTGHQHSEQDQVLSPTSYGDSAQPNLNGLPSLKSTSQYPVQPGGWRQPPTGFIPPHGNHSIYYTQSSVGYQDHIPPQNSGIMYPPQTYQSSTLDVRKYGNGGQVHINGPAQNQDLLNHVQQSRDSHTTGQGMGESQRFHNIVDSGVAKIPQTSSLTSSMPQHPEVQSIPNQTDMNSSDKLINDLVPENINSVDNNIIKPGILEFNGKDIEIQRETIIKPFEDENIIDDKVKSTGQGGDSNFTPLKDNHGIPSPHRSPDRTPSPVYSDSWASGSSKTDSARSVNSSERLSKVENFKNKVDDDMSRSDRSSPIDVSELLDLSSDEF